MHTLGHVGKQRDVIITANERVVDHSRQPDFHLQQRASVGMSRRSFIPTVDKMKLLDEVGVRDTAAKSRVRVSNVSRTECARENYVKHVIEMNEEKCFDKFRLAINKFSPNSKVKIRSLSPATKKTTEDDNTSDSSEELQYGPGIVNKLKTKYLSMTLRENQKKGVRPSLSSMRKATSLDNLLDDDLMNAAEKSYQISSVISCVNKLEYSGKETTNCVTLNFSTDLKRARSMETLHDDLAKEPESPKVRSVVVSKTKVTNHFKPSTKPYNNGLNLLPLDSIVNEDIIIVENTITEVKNEDRKRLTSENKELPPPDVVKETLKIFENCQKKSSVAKSWNTSKYNSSPRSPEVSSKPCKTENKIQNCGKPVLYPKPVISSVDSKLKRFSPRKSLVETNTNGKSNQITEPDNKNIDIRNGSVQNGFSEMKKPNVKNTYNTKVNDNNDIDTRSSSPISVLKINFQTNKSSEHRASSPPNIIHFKVENNCSSPNGTVSKTEKSRSVLNNVDTKFEKSSSFNHTNSKIEQTNFEVSLASTNNTQNHSSPSPVTELFNGNHPNTNSIKKPSEKIVENDIPPVKNHTSSIENDAAAVDESNIRNHTTTNDVDNKFKHDILKPSDGLPVRQVGIIRPLVSTKVNNVQPALTPQEIEKNYINTKKSLDLLEKSNVLVVEKEETDSSLQNTTSIYSKEQSANSNNSPNGVNKPSTLWFNKPWNQQQNTMVFNFKDRKEVPDYIENDGLLLTTNRDRAKKILQESGGTGYIILGVDNGLDNSINESSTDAPTISCREEWQLISGPPSPCNVHFEGDNVVINGKSNLRKHPREKKLRIQFNDTSTTFEYPSEASLLEEDLSSLTNGGSSLASYVPSKLSMGECFELGVTRSNGIITNVVNFRAADKIVENSRNTIQQNENSLDYLKPASENENIAWSEESIPDLLF
ncbi:uncharacterized protein LOC135841158 isoform X2 [Planococcus citri]|uniref:uncharacterized protein LOC135841158 isoform X2 n=1 Tax=Planococcus citri TaxID=170843 RepID=UPI0031F9AABC